MNGNPFFFHLKAFLFRVGSQKVRRWCPSFSSFLCDGRSQESVYCAYCWYRTNPLSLDKVIFKATRIFHILPSHWSVGQLIQVILWVGHFVYGSSFSKHVVIFFLIYYEQCCQKFKFTHFFCFFCKIITSAFHRTILDAQNSGIGPNIFFGPLSDGSTKYC